MIFKETKLKGAFVIELEKFEDERGFFALSWSRRAFAEHSLESELVECNVSFNRKKGTLRGMHYQEAPYSQVKVIRCTMGSVYDVIVDLRRDSPSFKQWIGQELTATNRLMMYVPRDFAHGFQTLEDNTEILYMASAYYAPGEARGVRYDDPVFAISWPLEVASISDQDRNWPMWNPT